MKSILQTINTVNRKEGIRIVIAGAEKVGKTSLACDAPDVLLVPLEVGYSGITVAKTTMIQKYLELEHLMGELLTAAQQGGFPYKTIVFDSATALERLLHSGIVALDPSYKPGNKKSVTMDSALGGYGKAFSFANEKFGTFLHQCDQLAVYGGINIILTCHVFAAKLVDPTSGEYDSWDLLLHSPKNQKTYGKREMITQWADIIGYFYEPMYITKGEGETMVKGVSANKGRVLAVSRTPSYTAGNRYGMEGEIQIPKEQSWNHFAQALYNASGIFLFKQ